MQGALYFVSWRLAKEQPVLTPEERTAVAEGLKYFDGARYELVVYVVMDDHVHALLQPLGENRLQDIVHSWKSFTANELTRMKERSAPVWQEEYFDRIVRGESDLIEKARYILGNSVKRWPEVEEYQWVGYGSWEG